MQLLLHYMGQDISLWLQGDGLQNCIDALHGSETGFRSGMPSVRAQEGRRKKPIECTVFGYTLVKEIMSVPKTKILVIDDDEGACEFVKLTLQETRKFQVVATTSAREGLRLAEMHRPNLVLLDIMMPEMSGAEVAEKLVKNEKTCDIPIAFITGLLTKEDVEKRKGFIHGFLFISKPVTPIELIEQVESVLAVVTRQKAFVKSLEER